jgi:hypothetical protein
MKVTHQLSYSKIECCDPGVTCVEKGIDQTNYGVPPPMRSYLDNNDMAGFFKHEHWQTYFPELIAYPDVVNYIITHNPRALMGNEGSMVFLKNKDLPLETDNIYFGLKAKEPCDEDQIPNSN